MGKFTEEQEFELFKWYMEFTWSLIPYNIKIEDNRQLMRFRSVVTTPVTTKDGKITQMPVGQEYTFLDTRWAKNGRKAPFINDEELIRNHIDGLKKIKEIDQQLQQDLQKEGLLDIEKDYLKAVAKNKILEEKKKIFQKYKDALVPKVGGKYEMDFANRFKGFSTNTEEGLTLIQNLKNTVENGTLMYVDEGNIPKIIYVNEKHEAKFYAHEDLYLQIENAKIEKSNDVMIDGKKLNSSQIASIVNAEKIIEGERDCQLFIKNDPENKELIEQAINEKNDIMREYLAEVIEGKNFTEEGTLIGKSTIIGKLNRVLEQKPMRLPECQNYVALKEMKNQFCHMDSYGTYPELTAEDKTNLSKVYVGAIEEMRKLHNNGLVETMQKELTLLQNADLSKGITLPAMLTQAETKILEISGKTMGVASGQLSVRMPMTIVNEENQRLPGFFTSEVKLNVLADYQAGVQKALDAYPQFTDIFNQIVSGIKMAMPESYSNDAYKMIDMVYKSMADGNNDRTKLSGYAGISSESEQGKLMQTKDFGKFLEMYLDNTFKPVNIDMVLYTETLGLKDNSSISDRNVAFSNLAKLLNVEHLVPKSVPMKVMNDGKVVNGIFMEFADGIDLSNLPLDSEVRSYNMKNFTGSPGLEQIADADILQYIAQSADNHLGNCFYKFEKNEYGTPKLSGIQLIDNDNSFGLKSGENSVGYCVGLDGIRVISENMANVIMNLKKEDLQRTLATNKLSKEEVDACWSRVENLQNKLTADNEYYKNNPTDDPVYVLGNHIRVVKSEDFAKFDEFHMSKLYNSNATSKSGFYKYCKDFSDAVTTDPTYMKPKPKAKLTDVDVLNEGGKNALEVEGRQLETMLSRFGKVDSFFKPSSDEFKMVKWMMEDIQERNALQQKKPDPNRQNDRLYRQAAYMKLSQLTEDYLSKKASEDATLKAKGKNGISQYAKDRVAFMKIVKDFAQRKITSIQNFNNAERVMRDNKKLQSDKREVLQVHAVLGLLDKYSPELVNTVKPVEVAKDLELLSSLSGQKQVGEGLKESIKMAREHMNKTIPDHIKVKAQTILEGKKTELHNTKKAEKKNDSPEKNSGGLSAH